MVRHGCRSNIGSGKAKFYGQFLVILVNRIAVAKDKLTAKGSSC